MRGRDESGGGRGEGQCEMGAAEELEQGKTWIWESLLSRMSKNETPRLADQPWEVITDFL